MDSEVKRVRDRVWASTGYVPVRAHRCGLILKALRRHLHLPGKEILDIGCGSGILARELAAAEASVTGLDPDVNCCEAAENLCAGRAQFLRMRAEEAAGLGRTYDCVIISEVLEHLEDDRGAVRAAASLLREGGLMLVTAPLHPSYWNAVDEEDGHYRRYRPGELPDLLRSAGLRVVETGRFHWLYFHAQQLYLRLKGRKFYSDAVFSGQPSTAMRAAIGAVFALDGLASRLGLGAHELVLAEK